MLLDKIILALSFSILLVPNVLGQQRVKANEGSFIHGVASGDPLQDAVVIWTRFTPQDFEQNPENIRYELSESKAFSSIAKSGYILALAENDFTVKVDVQGLQAGTYYYYRFIDEAGNASITGRTRTFPTGEVEHARIAMASCSDYRVGYFHPYRKIAERNDIDVVLHMGDYLYESGGGPEDRRHEPETEMFRLHEYRQRYSQYRLDPDLQRMHQVHPIMTIWDDHDIVVDALRDTSLRHREEFGSYQDRKFAAIKAAREWLPMRDPVDNNFYKNWRKTQFGNLAEIFMIDVRLYDRDRFATDINDTLYQSPFAKLLGPEQLGWLNQGLKDSPSTWKVIGNGLMIGQFRALNIPLILENWDGYPVERNIFYQNLDDNDVNNVVFGTGDFHVSLAVELSPEPYNVLDYNPILGLGSRGVEFVLPSITGGNLAEGDGPVSVPTVIEQLKEQQDFLVTNALELAIKAGNPHIKYANLDVHGYTLLDIRPERMQAEFWYVEDIKDPNNDDEFIGQIFTVAEGSNRLSTPCVLGQEIDQYQLLPTCQVSNPKQAPPPPEESPFVGITEQSNVLLSIFPNPSQEMLYVQLLNRDQSTTVNIVDLNGKLIKSQDVLTKEPRLEVEIDIADMAAGTYILRVGNVAQKFQKI